MTVTPARTSAPSRPGFGAPRRRRAVRFAAALVTALLLVGAPQTAMAAAQSATSTTPSPAPSSSGSGVVELTLAPVGNGVVRAGEALSVSVRVDNGTAAATGPVRVSLALGDTALGDRAALSAWLDGTGAGASAFPVVGAVDVPAVDAGSSQGRGITVAATDPSLATRAPGIYPLVASYPDGSGTVSSPSVMIVPDAAAAPTAVGVVVPITAPAIGGGLLTAAQLSDLTAPGGALTEQLDAVDATTTILAVDPAIVAAIRVLGTGAPASAAAWLTRLESLPQSRFALQFADADIAAQLQSGVAAPAQPTSLRTYMSASNFSAATGANGSTAAPPSYPSLDELLDVGAARSDLYWPAGGTAGPGVLSALAADDPGSLTLVPSATLTGADSARAVVGSAGVLAYDSDVSAALHEASLIDNSVLRAAPLTAATAYLVLAEAQSGGRALMVSVDRGDDRSGSALRASIAAALQAPAVTPVALDALARAEPVAAAALEVTPDAAATEAANALFDGETRIAEFATIVEDPSLLTGPQRAESLQLLGNVWRSTPDDWQSALAAHGDATLKTLDAVGILAPTTIQLLSPEAPLQFWVRNDLPYPVDVVLAASPDDLRLDVQRETLVSEATPRSNTRVEVPVTARVGSGEVSVDLQLRNVDGRPIGAAQQADVTVRADWEGIGLTALLVLIGALVVFGFVRTVLRRRRARRDAPAEVPSDRDESS